jgi:hypothetical protein
VPPIQARMRPPSPARLARSEDQDAAILVNGAAWLLARQHGAADRHDQGDDAVDALG